MRVRAIFSFATVLLHLTLSAQFFSIGTPPIRNFDKHVYGGGTQNWEIEQDVYGQLYFANNEGLLRFDGTNWDIFPIPNQTIIRSLEIDSTQQRIYVGGQGELGYFQPDAIGKLVYTSLLPLIEESDRNFADVWDIAQDQDAVYFRTSQHLFRYANDQMETMIRNKALSFLEIIDGQIFYQENDQQLYRYPDQVLHSSINSTISAILPYHPDTLLITTLKNGIFALHQNKVYPWPTNVDTELGISWIYSACLLPNQQIGLGTTRSGLIVLDPSGKLVMQVQKKKGLQKNHIRSLFLDRDQNLWLGLDNGIDFVQINAPFRYLHPDGEQEGAGYAAVIHQGTLYCGTVNGLFAAPWTSGPLTEEAFSMIPGTVGQVWSLQVIDNSLLMGHNDGAFLIENDRAIPLYQNQGVFTFLALDPDNMVSGNYKGLSYYKRTNGRWTFQKELSGITEPCRIMTLGAPNSIWISQPYRGIYQAEFDPADASLEVSFYNKESGLPSNNGNHVFEIKKQPVFTGLTGVFDFNPEKEQFQRNADFTQIIGDGSWIRYLKESPDENIWFIKDQDLGLIAFEETLLNKEPSVRIIPSLISEQMVGGHEHIYPHAPSQVFIGSEKGFMYLDPVRLQSENVQPEVLFRAITADSLLFAGGKPNAEENIALHYKNNILHFSFAATDYRQEAHLQYAFYLEGYEKRWNGWTSVTNKEYTSLPAGDYTFQVKARNDAGLESEVISYSFRINAPWYASKFALGTYLLLFVGGLLGFSRIQRFRFENEKAELQSEHQQIVQKQEAALSKVESEKLENEIKHKNSALASATMHLVQKGEMMQRLQGELQVLAKKDLSKEAIKKDINKIIRLLQQDGQLDEDWERFEYHFDQVHGHFLSRLRTEHPQLSPNDYKLCAYLRMNLTTKEIAPLMNISVRGVEASRYRLRKRLDLPNNTNLVEFIMSV